MLGVNMTIYGSAVKIIRAPLSSFIQISIPSPRENSGPGESRLSTPLLSGLGRDGRMEDKPGSESQHREGLGRKMYIEGYNFWITKYPI